MSVGWCAVFHVLPGIRLFGCKCSQSVGILFGIKVAAINRYLLSYDDNLKSKMKLIFLVKRNALV